MSTDVPAVVRMGHDLVRNLGHLPPETATMEIATHIRKFWEPRMRHELLARVRPGDRHDEIDYGAPRGREVL